MFFLVGVLVNLIFYNSYLDYLLTISNSFWKDITIMVLIFIVSMIWFSEKDFRKIAATAGFLITYCILSIFFGQSDYFPFFGLAGILPVFIVSIFYLIRQYQKTKPAIT